MANRANASKQTQSDDIFFYETGSSETQPVWPTHAYEPRYCDMPVTSLLSTGTCFLKMAKANMVEGLFICGTIPMLPPLCRACGSDCHLHTWHTPG